MNEELKKAAKQLKNCPNAKRILELLSDQQMVVVNGNEHWAFNCDKSSGGFHIQVDTDYTTLEHFEDPSAIQKYKNNQTYSITAAGGDNLIGEITYKADIPKFNIFTTLFGKS